MSVNKQEVSGVDYSGWASLLGRVHDNVQLLKPVPGANPLICKILVRLSLLYINGSDIQLLGHWCWSNG